jgi:hypothetical protein
MNAFFSLDLTAVVCDYLLDDARNQHGFLTMIRQDASFNFTPGQGGHCMGDSLKEWMEN